MRADHDRIISLCVGLAVTLLAGCAAQKPQPAAEIEVVSIDNSADTDALKAELGEQSKELSDLRAEIDHRRTRENDLTTRLKQALRSSPGKTISDHKEETASSSESAETIKQLQEELKQERQKRQQLEQQLAKLKLETSSPPIPVAAAPAPEPARAPHVEAAPAPVVAAVPPPEPETKIPPPPSRIEEAAVPPREPEPVPPAPPIEPKPPVAHLDAPPPADPLHALPEPTGGTAGEVVALRARSLEQETHHQEAIANLAQVLDADRRRQEDLEAEIVALRSGAPGTEGAVAGDSNEVNHLRNRLEEERRRNAELTAKLKLAGRVTDLVFRMQNQPGAVPPPAAAPPSYPRYSQQDTMPNPSAPNQPYMDAEDNVHQPVEPRMREQRGPRPVDEEQLEVPKVEVPPVFENQGPNVVEETTQD